MKKVFIMSLAVIFCFAMVMGCATTETKNVKGKSKHMKIKVKAENGEIVEVVGDDVEPEDVSAQELDPQQLELMYQGISGFTYVGVILHSHSSPGCAILCTRNRCYKVCN